MVTSCTRRELLAAGGGLALGALAGCAADDIPAPQPQRASNALLTPWLAITGGWRQEPQRLPFAPPALPAPAPRLAFLQPVGVAAAGEIVMVADAASRTLWRVDRTRDAMSAFAPFTGGTPEQGASLQVGNDFNVFVALPAEHRVVQYDARGQVVRQWRDEADAPRPVAVAVPEDRSQVLVGDGATARVVVFSPVGQPLRVLGGRGAGPLQSLTAMAFGPQGLYVLDRAAQQVVVLGPNGEVLDVVGEHQLVQPRALAVDRSGRVFVSDDAGQQIKVFRGSKLLAAVGGEGLGPARFGRIEALAIDGNLLYAADSVNARVQVLLVAPPSLESARSTP